MNPSIWCFFDENKVVLNLFICSWRLEMLSRS